MLFTFRTPPAPYRERDYTLGPGFCCVCGQPVYRLAGTSTFGIPDPTRTPSGTVLVWSRGSSGMRQVAKSDYCVASKVGGALKAAGGCGGMPKSTIGSRCSGSGANIEAHTGQNCLMFGASPTLR